MPLLLFDVFFLLGSEREDALFDVVCCLLVFVFVGWGEAVLFWVINAPVCPCPVTDVTSTSTFNVAVNSCIYVLSS